MYLAGKWNYGSFQWLLLHDSTLKGVRSPIDRSKERVVDNSERAVVVERSVLFSFKRDLASLTEEVASV